MSRDVEVLESKRLWVEMIGNLVPVTKSSDGEDQLNLVFRAFKENRFVGCFTMTLRDSFISLST